MVQVRGALCRAMNMHKRQLEILGDRRDRVKTPTLFIRAGSFCSWGRQYKFLFFVYWVIFVICLVLLLFFVLTYLLIFFFVL